MRVRVASSAWRASSGCHVALYTLTLYEHAKGKSCIRHRKRQDFSLPRSLSKTTNPAGLLTGGFGYINVANTAAAPRFRF